MKIFHYFRSFTSPWRRNPDFIIIGVQKGGTTSLYRYLCEHPDIIPALKKEVHYYDKKIHLGSFWYKKHFPLKYIHSNKICGEASPYYFFHPLAAQRINRDLPDVKLILLLRHPVERAYSHFQMAVRKKHEYSSDFLLAIKQERGKIEIEKNRIINNPEYISWMHPRFSYIERGKYFEQLVQWFKFFKREQILILKSENLFSRTNFELEKVHQFLGIRHIPLKKIEAFSKGLYQPLKNVLSEKEYGKLKILFRDDVKLLSKELGNEFEWDILNSADNIEDTRLNTTL